jgi:Zn-finger nucleic acid-binding protein
MMMMRRTFAEVVTRRRAWATGVTVGPQPIDRRELERTVACPSCQQVMDLHPYYGPGNVMMDSCPRCDTVWLDFGELRQIVDAPGRDRGSRSGSAPGKDDAVTGPPHLQRGSFSSNRKRFGLLELFDAIFR